MDLNNKVIVITGAGQGLGRGMAVSLAQEGANVALIDLNEADLDKTVALCHAEGPQAKRYITNVTSEAEVEATFNKIIADFGEIHGLVNNAGITRDALLIKADKKGDILSRMSLEQWQSVIDVNLTGVFLCGREAATKMVEKGTKGLVLNICSISKAGNMGQSNYSAAKSGAASLTVTWAKELARYGIRVAGISPGYISTKMTEAIKPEAMEKLVKMIPLRRMGEIDEIAHSVVYLFETDFFNGRILEMDGGMRL